MFTFSRIKRRIHRKSHYYYPILNGELVVDVSDGDRSIRVENATIAAVASSFQWNDSTIDKHVAARLQIAAWAIGLADPPELLAEPPEKAPNAFDKTLLLPGQHEHLVAKLATGNPIAIRVPMFVVKKGIEPQKSYFDIFLQYDPRLPRGDDQYIRSGINVSGITGQAPPGVRALLVVSDEPLAELLGDSENPSHELWQSRGVDILTQRYVRGPTMVQFVKSAIDRIARLLLVPLSKRDTSLLRDIFFVKDDSDESDDGFQISRGKEGGGEEETKLFPNLPHVIKSFLIVALKDGFEIKGNTKYEGKHKPIRIRCAYAVFRGNPFKQYREFDFKLGQGINVELNGVLETISDAIVGPNVLQVTPSIPDFAVRITGFDANRGVEIDAKSAVADQEAEA